jgi:hypothetical protein
MGHVMTERGDPRTGENVFTPPNIRCGGKRSVLLEARPRHTIVSASRTNVDPEGMRIFLVFPVLHLYACTDPEVHCVT